MKLIYFEEIQDESVQPFCYCILEWIGAGVKAEKNGKRRKWVYSKKGEKEIKRDERD